MRLEPREWFRGAVVVATRDLASNLKSVRVLVISLLMLLVMVGAAFGLSGLTGSSLTPDQEYALWSAPTYPDGNGSRAGFVLWVSSVFGTPREGVDIARGDAYDPFDPDPVFRENETRITNASGWAAFPDLGPGVWPYEMRVGNYANVGTVPLSGTPPPTNTTVVWRQFDVLGDFSRRDLGILAVDLDGRPVARADVRVNATVRGSTDGNGYLWMRLDPGPWNVTVDVPEGPRSFAVVVGEPLFVLPIIQGPDTLLYYLAALFMYLFGPIVAIAVSYDAMAKERMQGSLEILLARPATRTGLAVGKFLGTFLSVALPVAVVTLMGIVAVAGIAGGWPDAAFTAAFLLATLALLATYVLIMQIFSTVVKSPGTAILSAIMVWLVFNMLWSVVVLLIQAAAGIQGGTPEAFLLNSASALFNPSGVYQLTVAAALPASLRAGEGLYSLPDWTGPVASVVWIAVLLVLAVLLFRRKVV